METFNACKPPEAPHSVSLCVCVHVGLMEEAKSDAFECLSSGGLGKMEQAVICICNSRTRATLSKRDHSDGTRSQIHTQFCVAIQMRTFRWDYSIPDV